MKPIVNELVGLISAQGWESDFQQAVALANQTGLPSLSGIKTTDDYLAFIDELLSWPPTQKGEQMLIYEKIVSFYFVLDQEPLARLQSPVAQGELSQLSPLSQWMVDYAKAWGKFMDSTESAVDIAMFQNAPMFRWDDYMPPPSGYLTFNQFFARHTKPGRRPVAEPANNAVIVSPADSTFAEQWRIDSNAAIEVEDSSLNLKGIKWTLNQLLAGSQYSNAFADGLFTHCFLNNFDYHRFHSPVTGRVLEARVIPGQVRLDVSIQQKQTQGVAVDVLNADDGLGYQFVQMRGIVVLDSPIGLVACVPVGMAQVSSIVLTAEVGQSLAKGEELGYFQFGGSDFILVFQGGSQVELTAKVDTHYSQGAAIGRARVLESGR
ncbi:MAG: phosphatidylserine decarboxylase [Verrucomicrobiota bacterium]